MSIRRLLTLATAVAFAGGGVMSSAAPAASAASPLADSASTATAAAQEQALPGRIFGDDRSATSVAISRHAFADRQARTVYLARADRFTDALAGGSLTDGPVLLVPRTGDAPAAIRAEIQRLNVQEVVALGGPAAIADSVLRSAAGSVATARLEGADRYETAALISRRAFPEGAPAVYIANDRPTSPDAVVGGALSAGPVLPVPPTGVAPEVIREEITRLSPGTVYALGGANAVAPSVVASAADGRPGVRIAGADRYSTSAAIARHAFPNGAPTAYMARGDVFADAVAGGSLTDGPIVLVPPSGVTGEARATLLAPVTEALKALGATSIASLGGPAAIPDAVAADVVAAVPSITRTGPFVTPSGPQAPPAPGEPVLATGNPQVRAVGDPVMVPATGTHRVTSNAVFVTNHAGATNTDGLTVTVTKEGGSTEGITARYEPRSGKVDIEVSHTATPGDYRVTLTHGDRSVTSAAFQVLTPTEVLEATRRRGAVVDVLIKGSSVRDGGGHVDVTVFENGKEIPFPLDVGVLLTKAQDSDSNNSTLTFAREGGLAPIGPDVQYVVSFYDPNTGRVSHRTAPFTVVPGPEEEAFLAGTVNAGEITRGSRFPTVLPETYGAKGALTFAIREDDVYEDEYIFGAKGLAAMGLRLDARNGAITGTVAADADREGYLVPVEVTDSSGQTTTFMIGFDIT